MAATDPDAMLCSLVTPAVCQDFSRLHPLEGKVRLFAVGCCRCIWGLLVHQASREAVEAAEYIAEAGLQDYAEREARAALAVAEATQEWALAKAASAAAAILRVRKFRGREIRGLTSVRFVPEFNTPILPEEVVGYALIVARSCRLAAGMVPNTESAQQDLLREQANQPGSLRCLFGNPFRPRPVIDRAWLSWNDGTVRRIAEAVYSPHRFSDLPILADALEEAGCDDQSLLEHRRGPGPHVRGCWAVDLLLGRS
jgi:hypothetical protein